MPVWITTTNVPTTYTLYNNSKTNLDPIRIVRVIYVECSS